MDLFEPLQGIFGLVRACWRAIALALVMGGIGYYFGGFWGFALLAVPGALFGAWLGVSRDKTASKSVVSETILDALVSLVLVAAGYVTVVYGSMLIAGVVVACVIAVLFALSALV